VAFLHIRKDDHIASELHQPSCLASTYSNRLPMESMWISVRSRLRRCSCGFPENKEGRRGASQMTSSSPATLWRRCIRLLEELDFSGSGPQQIPPLQAHASSVPDSLVPASDASPSKSLQILTS
jgi:hypothetical protein